MKNKLFKVGIEFAFLLFLLMTSTAGATNYTLTVSAQGSGTVTKNPTNSTYPSGVTVIVTATPNAGWYFANWSGDTNGSVNPLNVVMNANLAITGNFLAFPTYSLTLVTNGQGTIALNPPGGNYLSNSIVTATATPADGWVFTGWTGGTNTSVNPLSLALNTNLALIGNFAQLPAFDVQPVSISNAAGSTISFSAHAVGDSPLGYQWFFSGGPLTNATNTTLSLPNVSSGEAGNYWAVATNNYGIATSHVASLTLTNATGSTNVVNSPDEGSLRAAINLGGWVSLAFNGTITLTNTINITNNVILDGTGVSAIISGGNAVRLFYVASGGRASGASLVATNLTLANGSVIITNSSAGIYADGGAIYNDDGIVTLVGCTAVNNSALSQVDGGVARGGAIFNNNGTMTLFRTSISNNITVGGGLNNLVFNYPTCTGLGGAIYNANGAVIISSCNVSSNFCEGACPAYDLGLTMGGALFQASGSLMISNSIFRSNLALGGNGSFVASLAASPAYGGALAITGGSSTIDNSQFVLNTAKGGDAGYHSPGGPASGGAIFSSAMLAVRSSTLSGNQVFAGNYTFGGSVDGSGGAIYNSGAAVLNGCSIYSNNIQGGTAIAYMNQVVNGGNGIGGGVFNASQFAATNCTIAFNSAGGGIGSAGAPPIFATNGIGLGGGVFNNSSATFTALNLTIASNCCSSPPPNNNLGYPTTNGACAGSQIANTNGSLALHNSIIAYGGTNSNAYGLITDDGFNICSDGSANLNSGASYNFTDPQLAPLANYGGPTLCMALLPSSPAIDMADSSDFPVTDQRGFIRPIGDGPDMGAFEYGSYHPVNPYLNITSVAGNVQLSFLAVPSGLYRLQASINLSTWTDLSTNGPFASPTNISQTISQQGFNVRFFRLLMQ